MRAAKGGKKEEIREIQAKAKELRRGYGIVHRIQKEKKIWKKASPAGDKEKRDLKSNNPNCFMCSAD